MKIEKINEHQIKFELLPQDLADRNISMDDIMTQNPMKVDTLFKEITGILFKDYQFYGVGTPLVFEAKMTHDTVSILVTRVGGNMDKVESMGGMSQFLSNMMASNMQGQKSPTAPPVPKKNNPNYGVFVFQDIDALAKAASHVGNAYLGRSRVCKFEGKVYLLLHNVGTLNLITPKVHSVLKEFAQKEFMCELVHAQILEKGQVLIPEDAIRKLKKYHDM